jgi:hypothetical protein
MDSVPYFYFRYALHTTAAVLQNSQTTKRKKGQLISDINWPSQAN